MEWNVKNALDRNVERQHLNKILKEIEGQVEVLKRSIASLGSDVGNAQQQLNNTVIKIINNEIPPARLATSVTLTGDVTGQSVPVEGQNAVTINCTIGDLPYIEDAPNDFNVYWRGQGQWQAVPPELRYLTDISGSGYAVWDDDSVSWITRSIQSADASRIIVTNGDGVADSTTIDLAEVVPAAVGALQLTRFDAYGRRDGEAPATTDNLLEGTTNLYWKEAPNNGELYGRRNLAWEVIPPSSSQFVPYFIPDGTTFTVPIYQQALYSQEIILDGTGAIIIEGILIEVD